MSKFSSQLQLEQHRYQVQCQIVFLDFNLLSCAWKKKAAKFGWHEKDKTLIQNASKGRLKTGICVLKQIDANLHLICL